MERDTRQTVAFTLAVVATVGAWLVLRPSPPPPPERTPLILAPDQTPHAEGGWIDLSPDGARLVFRRRADGGDGELWVRSVETADGSPIAETRGATLPAVSPDATLVAFTDDDARLRIAALVGGPGRTLAVAVPASPVRWSPDGAWIYFTNPDSGLSRVPAAGGDAEIVTRPDAGSGEAHWIGDVLPGGASILYTSTVAVTDDPRIELREVEGDAAARFLWSGRAPRYVRPGHLAYVDPAEPLLVAVPFDPEGQRVTGPPVLVASAVSIPRGWPVYAVSASGTLVYAAPIGAVRVSPTWVERDGAEREVDAAWHVPAVPVYSSVALSPDDGRLAISIPDEAGAWHLWIKTLGADAGPPSPLTTEGSLNYRPSWRPDGRTLTYLSDRAGQSDLWRSGLDGDRDAERILDRADVVRNGLVSPDGRWIVYREGEAPVADIFAVPVADTGAEPRPLVATRAGERSPELSPDGRLIAYTTNASGRWEVWVDAFLQPGSIPVLVSPGGGEEPVWANAGPELFYRSLDDELVAVTVQADPLEVGDPRVLLSMRRYLGSDGRAQYDVAADDARFLVLRILDGGDLGFVRVDRLDAWLAAAR